jgi:hypothetical protein
MNEAFTPIDIPIPTDFLDRTERVAKGPVFAKETLFELFPVLRWTAHYGCSTLSDAENAMDLAFMKEEVFGTSYDI